jgi:serine/threonine protein kinase
VKKPAPFGKYFLLERINVGGMAEVFRAKAFGVEGFERLVAVKRILPNIAEDKEFIRMFIEEAKLSVQLNHANIAQIFDLGVVDGSYYIALEHVHGRDLRGIFDRCRNVGEAMPVAQACFIVMKVCEGLDYAHNKRDQSGRELSLVHRDVSPQNVLVSFEGEVKLIDFGIAKAAGKGSKTQAGILKGKFGYMSPEQVRGLPVDRRSDVFSCGIVLYELLTGERLFVGESDFSTLEKVRNVEILPPSTYNRRIPDELERIVLKALAKDTEDRYQNAIDLHDELQAFVYTAGEFYSRKDLAGWMKKTFGKEIEEETAKLESYRQLKPPPQEPPTSRTITGRNTPPPVRKSTQAMSAMAPGGTKPPPPPAHASGPRLSQTLGGNVAAVPAVPSSRPPKDHAASGGQGGNDGLAWDDDELETQIYDNPEDDPRNKPPGKPSSKPLPLQAPSSQPGLAASPALAPIATPHSPTMLEAAQNPDLSSLVGGAAKAWDGSMPPNPATTLNGMGNGASKLATGSNRTVAPEPPMPSNGAMMPPPQMFDSGRHSGPMHHSGPLPLAQEPFDPMASFGQGIVRQQSNKRGVLMIAIGGALVAAIAVVAVILLTGDKEKGSETPTVEVKPPPPPADPNTGFDLYVTPPGTYQWKLDGESRTDKLPSRIRSITPGTHTIQIEPPPGFLSQSQQVTIELGKAQKVDITLQPIQGLVGSFDSTPTGATVSLIVDGKRELLGTAPQRAPLDPRHSYQVLFEKAGYVSVNRPIVFTGQQEEKLVVSLEPTGNDPRKDPPKPPDPIKVDPKKPDPKNTVAVVPEPKKPDPPKPDPKKPDPPKPDPPKPDPPKPDPTKVDTKPKGTGTLAINSKPPCEIYVDGANTGLYTPQSAMTLPAGPHRITLINNEFGINDKFTVVIKADAAEKVFKNYSHLLPK